MTTTPSELTLFDLYDPEAEDWDDEDADLAEYGFDREDLLVDCP